MYYCSFPKPWARGGSRPDPSPAVDPKGLGRAVRAFEPARKAFAGNSPKRLRHDSQMDTSNGLCRNVNKTCPRLIK